VPERGAGGLAAAIGRLLAEPALGAALGARGRSRVQTEYGWDRVADRFEAAYAAARDGGTRDARKG
jgi:glycosyltransferase involved in cell wall biosynthesis